MHVELLAEPDLTDFYLVVEDLMKMQAYGRIESFFNEMLIRAATILGLEALAPEYFDYQGELSYEFEQGFYGLEFTIRQLRYYQAHRDEFPRFDEFVPYFFRQLADHKDELLHQTALLPHPINQVFLGGKEYVYIVPTHETDPDAQQRIHAPPNM